MAAHGNRILETTLPLSLIDLSFMRTTTTCQVFTSECERGFTVQMLVTHTTYRISYVENPVGGWKLPAGKQFWDGIGGESVCDAHLDWDWSATPFW